MPMDVAHSITRVLVPLLCFLRTLRILKKENPILLDSPESIIRQDESKRKVIFPK